jgi:hypothetical protein
MKHTKSVLLLTAIVACLFIGIAYSQYWPRWMTYEPGTAEMVRWLDAPVPYTPWYGPGLTIGSAYSGLRSQGLIIGSAYNLTAPYYNYYYPYSPYGYWYPYSTYGYWYYP